MSNLPFGRKVYLVCLAAGTFVLVGGLVLQLFWPPEAADRSSPAVHQAFCSAHLLALQKELEEAYAHIDGLTAPSREGPLPIGANGRSWQQRLDAIEARCRQPSHAALAGRLAVLAMDARARWAQSQALWQGEGRSLEAALRRASHQ